MKHNLFAAISLVLMLTLAACGGGGSTSDTITLPEDNTTPPVTMNTISLSGTAIDGYISGAKACLDINSDGVCQGGEPTTTTATDGTFSFTNVEVEDNKLLPVIVSGGTDTATNKPFVGKLKNIIDSATITAGTSLKVTPLTDLIASSFLKSTTKDTTALTTAKTKVATIFDLSVADVDADPMTNLAVFAKTQEVQQIKALIEATTTKASGGSVLTTVEKDKLLEDIKESLVAQIEESIGTTLDIDSVLGKVEIKSSITLPANEKAFVSAQVGEVKSRLDTLATSSTATDKLDELQKGLEEEQAVALKNIDDATSDSTITVVTISDTTKLIEQGEPVSRAPTAVANSGFSTPPTTPTY